MKTISTLLLFLLISITAFSQNKPEAVSFKKIAREKSADLHTKYPKVANVEFKSCKTAHERHEKVDKIWHDLWHNFTEYYHQQGLVFNKKKKLFVHLHFNETGHLDYFGYHFKKKEDDQTHEFVKHFRKFVEDYKFDLAEGVNFSQCGELHLIPRKGLKEGL